jgi:2-amino-4-hydroxy-6-hydroxymethyldihydropteridine diphosphokinase
MMETVYIGLGSNLGSSKATLLKAWKMLAGYEGVVPVALSSPYLSAPVNMASSHWFTNAVGCLKTYHAAYLLLELLFEVEQSLGRMRKKDKWGYQDRSLDLDMLYFGSSVYDEPKLTIPHPRLSERLFVLKPLVELAPDFLHPSTGVTNRQLLMGLEKNIMAGRVPVQEISKGEWPLSSSYNCVQLEEKLDIF